MDGNVNEVSEGCVLVEQAILDLRTDPEEKQRGKSRRTIDPTLEVWSLIGTAHYISST